HYHLHWQLIARSGVDTVELTELLQAEPPRQFDAALLLVGVNDVTGSRSTGAWLEAFEQLLELVRNRFGVRRLIVFPVPPCIFSPPCRNPCAGIWACGHGASIRGSWSWWGVVRTANWLVRYPWPGR